MPPKKRTTKPRRTQKQKQKQSQIVNVRLARESSKSDRAPAPIILGGGGTTSQFIPQYIQQPASSTFGVQDVRDIVKSSIEEALKKQSPFEQLQMRTPGRFIGEPIFNGLLGQTSSASISPQPSFVSRASTFDTFSMEPTVPLRPLPLDDFTSAISREPTVPLPLDDFTSAIAAIAPDFYTPQEKTKSTIMENLPALEMNVPKPESKQGESITEEQYVSLVKPIENIEEPSPLIAAIRPLIKQGKKQAKPTLEPILEPILEPTTEPGEASFKKISKRQKDREYYQQNKEKIIAQKKAAKEEKAAKIKTSV